MNSQSPRRSNNARQSPLQRPLRGRTAEPAADLQPPLFAGVQTVELLGEHLLRATWDPARDNLTPADAITYEVYHHIDLFREPSDDDEPVAVSAPGATSLAFEAQLPGEVYVRAVDDAGLRSPIGGTLYQRVQRPIVSALDSRPVAQLLSCATIGPGLTACVGRDGFAARWDRDHWTTLDVPAGLTWNLERTPDATWLFSELGHLYRLGADASLEPIGVRFDHPPSLPLRHFTVGPLGLMYWIDAAGAVFVGVPGDFRRMQRPLALPASEGCTRLQTLVFDGPAGFAVCDDGTVYSARLDSASLRWTSLTVSTPHDFNSSMVGVFASDDTGGLMFGPDGVHRVGVGGWTPILPMGQPLDNYDPRSSAPNTLSQVEKHGADIIAATDIGILRGPEGFFNRITDTDHPAAGFVLPMPLQPDDLIGLITPDASVGTVQAERLQWTTPPRLTGFIAGAPLPDGHLLAATQDELYLLSGDQWASIAPTPVSTDAPLDLRFVHRDAVRGTLLAGVAGQGGGTLLKRTASGWAPLTLLVRDLQAEERNLQRMLEAAERARARQSTNEAEGSSAVPDPPVIPLQPMLGRVARAGELPPPSEPVDIDTHPDGRGVIATRHEVWWRLSDSTWVLLLQRQGTIDAVALDAGDGFVLSEDGRAIRCVRDLCEGQAPDAANAPGDSRALWKNALGLHAMLNDASVVRFEPAVVPDDAPPLTSVVELPAGSWVEVQPATDAALPDGQIEGRTLVGEQDLIWLADGSVYELIDNNWTRQGQLPAGFTLWSDGSTWGIFGPRGLLTLAPVDDVTF